MRVCAGEDGRAADFAALFQHDAVFAQRGAGLALVFADGFVVVGAGAELGGFGFDELFLQAEDLEGGAGSRAEPLLTAVEAFAGQFAGSTVPG